MTFVKEAALACLADLNGFTKIKAISNKTDRPPVIGIDIGKTIFHLIGLDRRGAIVFKTKLSRSQLENRLANMPSCPVGMEACVGAHHLSRQLIALGHDARLMPAKYVKAFLKGNKNDFRDAEAIAEAAQRPTMRFVATKTAEQLDLQGLHRVRARLVSERTATVNEIRRLPAGSRDRGGARHSAFAPRAAGHPWDEGRQTVAAHGPHHRGPGLRLAPVRLAHR